MQSGNLSGSRWGIKGSETLGDGLKAIFVLENGFNDVTGAPSKSNTLFSRLAFVGISSNRFGSLTMGRQYSSMTDFVHPVSPSQFVGGIGASPGNIDHLDTTSRVDNSIKYVSERYGGVQFGALYGFGGQAGSLKRKSTWSVGAGYADGPLQIGAGYERSDNSKTRPTDPTSGTWDSSDDGTVGSSISEGFATAQTQEIFAAGATYNFGYTRVGVDYSNVRFEPGASSLFAREAIFNTVGVFGDWTHDARFHVFAGYTYTRSSGFDDAGDRAQYHDVTFGLSCDLSKRTTIYALAGYQKAIGKNLDSLGNVVDATASVGDKGIGHSAAIGSQSNVRVGIRHRF
jgi:predicted porin